MGNTITYDTTVKTYSTRQAAKLAGIGHITLYRWMAAGKVGASESIRMNGHRLFRWTSADVKRIRKYKSKNYRKGRGRKAKPKR
jgi:transposase